MLVRLVVQPKRRSQSSPAEQGDRADLHLPESSERCSESKGSVDPTRTRRRLSKSEYHKWGRVIRN